MNAQTVIGGVVTAVWTVSTLATFADRTYHPPDGINALMMLVAGFFFATGMRKSDDGDEDANGA